jgi:THO complex subunit 2
MLTFIARCLKAILVDLDAWYKDQKKYEQEGLGMSSDPGSTSAQLPGMMYRPHTGGEFKHMPWTAFRIFNMTRLHSALFRVCGRLYMRDDARLTRIQAIKSCWQQTDFMHIKNGITVALQVLPIFPLLDDHGHGLFEVMEELEKRTDLTPDLKQGCRAYMVQLQKRITVRPYIKTEDFSAVCHISVLCLADSELT